MGRGDCLVQFRLRPSSQRLSISPFTCGLQKSVVEPQCGISCIWKSYILAHISFCNKDLKGLLQSQGNERDIVANQMKQTKLNLSISKNSCFINEALLRLSAYK